jgi:hypothetical protein
VPVIYVGMIIIGVDGQKSQPPIGYVAERQHAEAHLSDVHSERRHLVALL